jgi:hypothetical protein
MGPKEARVTEAVVVRKEAEQRTGTVSDTVRETKVELEDERGNRVSGTGTTEAQVSFKAVCAVRSTMLRTDANLTLMLSLHCLQ